MRTELVQLLHSVSSASNEANSPEEAIATCLKEVCAFTGWPVGQAFLVPSNTLNQLILIPSWYAKDETTYRTFREATESSEVVWGGFLAGRILATAQSEWISSLDLLSDANRKKAAHQVGLRSGFAFPVLLGRDVVAVLEFFSEKNTEENSELFEIIEVLATHLARVIERNFAEVTLIKAREAAIDASMAKSDFLAQMSHEIRTPINAVMGMANLLLTTHLSTEQKEYAETIDQAVKSLLVIVNDILDISKIEAGKFEVRNSEFQLDVLLRDVLGMLQHQAIEKGLDFTSSIDPAIPATLRGDAGILRQILVNLIGNAIKFTAEGKVSILALSQEQTPEKVSLRFEIEDSGIGIPNKMHSKIFDIFTQADGSAARKFGGTGLGLSISRRLVELLGGNIGFQSKEKLGSVFWFTLQFEKGLVLPIGLKELNFSAIDQPSLPEKVSILIVEDNPINQRVALRTLEKKGIFAEAVENGEDAIVAIQNDHYDLVLMDCQMPEMDGYETTRRIRALEIEQALPRIPIIAVTANAVKGDRERCLEAGMNDYLSKPVQPEDLWNAIQRWLSNSADTAKIKPVLDRERLKKLQGNPNTHRTDDLELFRELVSLFKIHSPPRLQNIAQTVLSQDASSFQHDAHYLKSSCANLGLSEMSEVCRLLEEAGRQQNFQRAVELQSDLERLYREGCAALDAEL